MIVKQEAIGILRSITDGEITAGPSAFRFPRGVDGVEMAEAEGIKFAAATFEAEAPHFTVKGKLARATILYIATSQGEHQAHAQDDDPQPIDAALSRPVNNHRPRLVME